MNALIILNLCHGVVRPLSLNFCEAAYPTIENIVRMTNEFDFCFIANDKHSLKDNELKYLPPHMIEETDCARLYYQEYKITSKHRLDLRKNTANLLNSYNNKAVIESYGFDQICLAGFTASLDILPTALGFLDFHPNTFIVESCVADMSLQHKARSLEYLEFMGIPILKENYYRGMKIK